MKKKCARALFSRISASMFSQQILICVLHSSCKFVFFNLQDNGLVPIVEPEILLDGSHGIDRTFEVAQKVWSKVFFFLAENNVLFEGILLKPSMVTPGAECPERAAPDKVAEYTLSLLKRRVPPSVPGIMVSHSPVNKCQGVYALRMR